MSEVVSLHKQKLRRLRADFDEARGTLEYLRATAQGLCLDKPSERLENVDQICLGLDVGLKLLLDQIDGAINEP